MMIRDKTRGVSRIEEFYIRGLVIEPTVCCTELTGHVYNVFIDSNLHSTS